MRAADACRPSFCLRPADDAEALYDFSSSNDRRWLSVNVRQYGDSRKCWLPQYFYPLEDLQIGRGLARLRNDGRQVVGDHVQFPVGYAIQRDLAGGGERKSALSYAYDPEHAADHTRMIGMS
ncbi:hypothetical protein ASE23_29720 [Rhizobium sp. Root73]|nr:hypothetical protein ASD36_29670 [Rhizobium sp. Root1334]KRC00848.1 hypothetical protein ASE23_29720 [Rhizobium sp. Root73]